MKHLMGNVFFCDCLIQFGDEKDKNCFMMFCKNANKISCLHIFVQLISWYHIFLLNYYI